MANFVPSKGHDNCPKCGGWQVLDKTSRKANGWPIGPLVFVDCDHCHGKGEVATARPVNAWPIAPEPGWQIPPPKVHRICNHFNQIDVWGVLKCLDCEQEIKP